MRELTAYTLNLDIDIDWYQALAEPLLPVSPVVKQQALQKLAGSAVNASNLGRILTADPALCLPIFSAANRSLANSGNECQSLTHAISLLGFPRLEDLIQTAPEYDAEDTPQSRHEQHGYQQQLMTSLHASYQAKAWAALNPYWSPETVFWPTLLRQAPLWGLWHRAPNAMRHWQAQRATYCGAAPHQLEEAIFGNRLNAIALQISRQWHLPEHSQHSWQSEHAGSARQWAQLARQQQTMAEPKSMQPALEDRPELQQLCSRQPFLIALANQFAEAADWDWYSRQTFRLQTILATVINKPLPNIIQLQHQQAVNFSQQQTASSIRLPAQQLFGFERKWEQLRENLSAVPSQTTSLTEGTKTQPEDTKAEASKSISASTTEQSLLDEAPSGFAASMLRLQQADSFKDIHALMNFAVDSLCEEANFERASISLLNIKSRELRTFYSSGTADSPMLKNFRHTLRKGDLLNKLLQKPLSLRLHHGNYAQLWPLLPGNLKQASGADELVMMSLFLKQKPFGLIYADNGLSNHTLSDQHYSLFKQLCNALSPCIQQILERSR